LKFSILINGLRRSCELNEARIYVVATTALFTAALITVLATAGDYGISWDEPLHWPYASGIVDFFASGLVDRHVLEMGNRPYYGGIFLVPVELLARLFTEDIWYVRKVCTALVAVLGVFGACRLANLLGGPASAFWSALLLLTLPSFYGHAFINPKDIPFATG